MDELDLFARLGLALAIGLLFGIERGWHGRDESEGDRIAGVRTFALTGLLGGITGWLTSLTGPLVLGLALTGLALLLAASYWAQLREDDDFGLTTEIAMMLSFVLGAASVLGEMAPAAAVAVIAALLLAMKPMLHRWVGQIERFELHALFKLALISVVILPLLPDQGYGPGEVLNPFELWRAVVIVAGLSFFGYVAIRIAGTRIGIPATGLFGGLASSTSTTLALARLVRAQSAFAPLASAGILIAGSVTFLRILALVAIFEPSLVLPLTLPMLAMAATGFLGALAVHLGTRSKKEGPDGLESIANPLELRVALTFGVLLALVLLGVHYLRDWLGTGGVLMAAAISGMTDVDALTISVARLVGGDLPASSGTTAIFIAAAVNTAVKGGIALVAGNAQLGMRVIAVYAAVIAAGAAALWLGS